MISLRDWVGAVAHLAEHDSVSGPVNLCCPETPTNGEFTKALAEALDRKAFVAAPKFAIKLGAGPLAPEALGSINLRPAVLEASGYAFQRPRGARRARPQGCAEAGSTEAIRQTPPTRRSVTLRVVTRRPAGPPAARARRRPRRRASDR